MIECEVPEGEGIVGPASEVAAQTNALSNCIGVAMATDEGMIGLYHYPGNGFAYPGVQAVLIQMLNDLHPELVVVTPAKNASGGLYTAQSGVGASDPEDLKRLLIFLRSHAKDAREVTEAKPNIMASIQHNGQKPIFNEWLAAPKPLDLSNAMAIKGPKDGPEVPSRRMLGGIMYYGRKG